MGGCAAVDSGTTELTEHDVARLRRKDVRVVKESIDRGRAKLALWIRLIEAVEEFSGDEFEGDTSEAAAVLAALPLSSVTDRATERRVAALLRDRRALVEEAVSKLRRRS
jgi:hypothetical protein